MSYISIQVKESDADIRSEIKLRKAIAAARIDRTETSFGGKGYLTKQQFAQGMALAGKMRRKTSW